MKKFMISFFILLFLIIVSVCLFLYLYSSSKKAGQETSSEITGPSITAAPTPPVTPTLTPTIAPTPTAAPEAHTELYPAYQKADGKVLYGYVNKSGEFVIKPAFDFASDFNDGVAVVKLDGKYYVINEGGDVVFLNDGQIADFSDGAAVFTSNGDTAFYGYVDATGKIIIEAKYTMATNFNEDGTAYVCTGSGEYALIDKTGKVLESYTLDKKYDNPRSLQDGYLIYTNKAATKYGVINVKGEEILELKYGEIRYLGNGLFAVKKAGSQENMTAKEALFNQKGEPLTDYSFYDLSPYQNGYCSATDDTTTYFVGTDGKAANNLPVFDGRGTLKLLGDVVSAYVDEEQIYSSTDKLIFWQPPHTYSLSNNITVRELILRPNRYVLVKYPEIDGVNDASVQDQINSQLKSIFTDSRKNLTAADNFTVDDSFSAKLINNLLVVEKDGYDFYFGAAHGMPIMNFYYFDLRTGAMYQPKDLFMADSDYKTKLNELITNEINAQIASGDSVLYPNGFVGITDTQYFKLQEDAISIYFYPTDIAPFGAGFPEFLIPFDDISDCLDTAGAFWNSFQPVN